MPEKTFYAVLGLGPDASAAEVKRQYRRLAKRYHPDLNPNNLEAPAKFRELQAAYEVLSDPIKRRQYDAELGYAGNPQPDSSRFYRRYQPSNRTRRRYHAAYPVSKATKPRAAYSQYTVEVTLPELFKGTRRVMNVGVTYTCRYCRGAGKLVTETGMMVCPHCDGYGFLVSFQQVPLVLPPGLMPGMSMRLDVFGGQPESTMLDAPVNTNILVTVQLSDSGSFEFRDNQLHTTTAVQVEILNEGGEWTIPAPDGGTITFNIPAHTTSGSILVLRKRGLPRGSSHKRGNLYCTVVAVPAPVSAN